MARIEIEKRLLIRGFPQKRITKNLDIISAVISEVNKYLIEPHKGKQDE